MSGDRLDQLATVAEALYLREHRGIRSILEQEAMLRRQLAQLSDQDAQARRSNDAAIQALGADVLWQQWLSRTRRRLNTDLALVMARKLSAMNGLRAAFGRQQAARSLRDGARDAQLARVRHLRQARLLDGPCGGGG